MGYRLRLEQGRYCSRRLALAAWLIASPMGVWAQNAADTPAPPKKIDLYAGQAEKLLSNTRWQHLLAMQPAPEAEAVSDSRDWSDTGNPVVKVEGERTAPEVPGGIGGLFWALRHPTQAWRILAPAQ